MIAVTGAGGKTGLAIVEALAQRGAVVRGLVHKQSDQAKVAAAGAVESVVGNVADVATLQKVLRGVQTVYHICPNMHPDEAAIGATILEQAQAAGLQHFVYHSVLHPQTAAMPHHWQKLLVEDGIFDSGLPFTILQPTVYMQNFLGYWQAVRQTGLYTVPYPVTTRLSLVNLKDVAEVAARVLTEPGHAGATYELVGTPPLTQLEVASVMSAHLGFAVTANELTLDQWEQEARQQGLHEYAVQTLRKMFSYYAANGLVGNAKVLAWLLGRQPTSLESFIGEIAARNV
jgi:NAD(P)H dehydrogenase (quinone)